MSDAKVSPWIRGSYTWKKIENLNVGKLTNQKKKIIFKMAVECSQKMMPGKASKFVWDKVPCKFYVTNL